MKKLFSEGNYTAYGKREGATYTVEIRDNMENIKAWKWFNNESKTAGENVPYAFYDMIKKAVYRA